ncbi:MAG: protein phosphatase CheZ [Deltaproteobacteria bacterium]|nr:protein phosphatase CheZ [Deltaproteobacteria bacterium]
MEARNWNDVMSKIKDELSSLAQFVDKTRRGIDTLETTVRAGTERFPEASNQIAAVTGDLENAANNIMSILEGLMTEQDKMHTILDLEGLMTEQDKMHTILEGISQWAGSLPGEASEKGLGFIKELGGIHEKTKTELMDIFTNMSFHDLSGQKLKKVISSLAVVESKLLEMALSFGFEGASKGNGSVETKPEKPMNQDVVDRLLKELGA